MYKAIKTFTDLQDNNHRYHLGDVFPRDGLVVSDARLKELSSNRNRRHEPMIEEVAEEPKEKPKAEPKKTTKKKGKNVKSNL